MPAERAWDPWKTFKVSDKERELIDRRRRTRDAFRAEFNKLLTDPRKEHIIDHNFERWHAYRNQQVELMNIWRKNNLVKGFLCSFFPCIIAAIFMKRTMDKRERKIMSGELTWRDRIRSIGGIGTTT